MVKGTRLEIERPPIKWPVGSNPTPSASYTREARAVLPQRASLRVTCSLFELFGFILLVFRDQCDLQAGERFLQGWQVVHLLSSQVYFPAEE